MKTLFLIKAFLFLAVILSFAECKKDSTNNGGGPGGGGGTGGGNPPVDPPTANTVGFFLNEWAEKNFTTPTSYDDIPKPTTDASIFVTIDASAVLAKVPSSIFAQNANVWMSQMVTEPALMTHITNLHPGIIRFPGGSLSDVYFWNAAPNVRPADVPDSLLDANGNKIATDFWYGKNTA